MNFEVNGRAAFAYTAAHEIDPARRSVVFVHGAGLDHSWWGLQSRYFGYHGFNVLAVDLPAHGRSEGPALTSIGEMADWVAKVLDARKIKSAALVGHSMGSLIALEFAARYPRVAERIALIGTAYPMKVGEAFLDAARRTNAFVRRTVAIEGETGVRGGVKGSHPFDGFYGKYEFLNWAAKFAIDACRLELRLRPAADDGGASGARRATR